MTLKTDYDRCLETMYGLRRFGIKLGLSTIRNILKRLGNPQDGFSCIHVAGTNGKGSIASALSSILHSSGYRVGLYTSPHLVHFNERIQTNHRPISNENVVKSYKAIIRPRRGEREPTFFEFSTAMALYEFGMQNVDWAVIETGMGGRLDATNIIKPALSIISNVSLEHQAYLGNSISQIAREKGGIIKRKTPVVTGVTQKNAVSVIEEIAGARSAPLYRYKSAFRVRRKPDNTFTYFGIDHLWRDMRTPLLGKHQIDNAALVLAACEILQGKKTHLTRESIVNGLAQTRWPGRLDIVSTSPLVILDGAHNLMAARTLAEYLSENLSGRNITLVVGMMDDKAYKAILRRLLPLCSRAVLTRSDIDHAIAPEKLYPVAKKIVSNTQIVHDVGKAVKYAIDTASPDDVVCISGSLYVVGEAKAALGKNTLKNGIKIQGR
ncbi:MAG: folylpolyglutamate synthase/dihydrofolate synthase family protein [Pseudomonadota bacterium]